MTQPQVLDETRKKALFEIEQKVKAKIADVVGMIVARNLGADGIYYYRIRYVNNQNTLVLIDMAEFELEAVH